MSRTMSWAIAAVSMLALAIASNAAWAQTPVASSSTSWRALIFELLLLVPLAALAFKLKTRKAGASAPSAGDLMPGKSVRLANGAQAQILYAKDRAVLVVHAKNGSASLLDLGSGQPCADAPAITNTEA